MINVISNQARLPDPELTASAVAHARRLNQVTIDAIQTGARKAVIQSEPFAVRKIVNELHPLRVSPKDIKV